jgi:hypothetical protein
MPRTKNADVTVTVLLNLEGHWPRETYRAICQREGRAYAEADYLRWRDVGERLSGQLSFETTVARASAAFNALALSMAEAGRSLAKAMAR